MDKVILPTALCAIVLLFSACEQKGPMERTGEKVDETVRTIQNGGEKTTGDKINDATDDLKKGVENAADDAKK
jgi:predicted small lipoprotein YifL